MKKFLSLPFINVTTSSKAWVTLSDLAIYLEMGDQALRNRVLYSDAAPFRTIRPKTNELIKAAKRANFQRKPNRQYFDLDFALAAVFSMSNQPARKMRDQVTYVLNNLFYDGFVSVKNYHLDVEKRRAITAFVVGVDHYYDIIKARWDLTDQCRGTALAPVEVSVEKLCIPDYYLDRAEVTKIKAIDLAMHLLITHCYVEDKDSALDELLGIIGVSLDAGICTDAQTSDISKWVKKHHNTPIKTLGDTDV
jgi:hypothetical protein